MKTIKLLLLICIILTGCKKSDVKPIEPTPIVTPGPVIKNYNFQFLFQGGHNTSQDTLIIKLNDVTKTVSKTYFPVKTGDKVSIYYNPGYHINTVDSNKVKLTLSGETFKVYNCTCITNESIIIP